MINFVKLSLLIINNILPFILCIFPGWSHHLGIPHSCCDSGAGLWIRHRRFRWTW